MRNTMTPRSLLLQAGHPIKHLGTRESNSFGNTHTQTCNLTHTHTQSAGAHNPKTINTFKNNNKKLNTRINRKQ